VESAATQISYAERVADALKEFATLAEGWFAEHTFLVPRYTFFQDLFRPERLKSATWEEFQGIGANLHAFSMQVARKRAFGQPNYPIERYRVSFTRLAHGAGTTEERARWFLEDESSASKYIQQSAVAEIVAYLDGSNYVICNSRARAAVAWLGIPVPEPRTGDSAERIEAFSTAVRPHFAQYEKIVRRRTTVPVGLEFDQFLSWVSETKCDAEAIEDEDTGDGVVSAKRVWLIAPGQDAWLMDTFVKGHVIGIGWADLGDLRKYKDREALEKGYLRVYSIKKGDRRPTNSTKALWDFSHMKRGDIVIAKRGLRAVVGCGVVSGEYFFEKRDGYDDSDHLCPVHWMTVGDWPLPPGEALPMKTITQLKRPDFVDMLLNTMQVDAKSLHATGQQSKAVQAKPTVPVTTAAPLDRYTLDHVLTEAFLSKERAQTILDRLATRKAVILQGPPGSGKSFVARRIAYALMGEKAPDRVQCVQFHQSTSYEDFIQGYRPTESGTFELRDGHFVRFCAQAAADASRPWVFIIDEINRGNLSKVFGEVLVLLEHDKRCAEYALPLAYQRQGMQAFFIPPNVHVIGMMNTADRSLALVDYALRRRFSFITLEPAFAEPRFRKHLDAACAEEDGLAVAIIERVTKLNQAICSDTSNLGPGYAIGHSYFCPPGDEAQLTWESYRQIVRTEIAPLLEEYWFDQSAKAHEHIQALVADVPA